MVFITLFPASNCIISFSSSRKEESRSLGILLLTGKSTLTNCGRFYSVSQSLRALLHETIEDGKRSEMTSLTKKCLPCSWSHACVVKTCHLQSILKIKQNLQLESYIVMNLGVDRFSPQS